MKNIEDLNISRDTLKAINSVYQSINYDLPDDLDNDELIELCIDADRLKQYGFNDAQEEISEILNQFDYNDVLEAISETLILA